MTDCQTMKLEWKKPEPGFKFRVGMVVRVKKTHYSKFTELHVVGSAALRKDWFDGEMELDAPTCDLDHHSWQAKDVLEYAMLGGIEEVESAVVL